MDDISSLFYWGERSTLIAASWDTKVRLYDDSTSEAEGVKRYTMPKHKEPVNFIDFKEDPIPLCASCSDDTSVVIYNYGSYRQEGILPNH